MTTAGESRALDTLGPDRVARRCSPGLALVLLALAISLLAVSTQSFWIDEAAAATKARQPTLQKWWERMVAMKGSDQQMPLYMAYLWIWEKLFGHGEWWLRAANVPWLAVGMLAIPRRFSAICVLLVLNPFVWYYLDETRPYIMQIGASLLLLGSLWRLAECRMNPRQPAGDEKLWVGGFCLAMLVLSGSSLLGVIWAGASVPIALTVLGWPYVRECLRKSIVIFSLTGLLLALLARYYLWTFTQDLEPSPGHTSFRNALFVVYELLGFTGLGPGRLQMRTEAVSVFFPFAIPLVAYLATVACVGYAGGERILRRVPRRVWLGVTVSFCAVTMLLLAAGVAKHFRVLGRHFAPLAPILALVIFLGLCNLWQRGGWRRMVAVLFVLLNLGSNAMLRLAPRHAKDDYRAAAAVGNEAVGRGERVWWCADEFSGIYYELPLAAKGHPAAPGEIWSAVSPLEEQLTNQPPPRLVILSKPDLYDLNGSVRSYLAQRGYQVRQTFTSFAIWERKMD